MITERMNDMDGSVTISNNHPHGICVQTILPMKGDVSYQHLIGKIIVAVAIIVAAIIIAQALGGAGESIRSGLLQLGDALR